MDLNNTYKLQRKKIDVLLEELNSLSLKEYYYKYKENNHYLCFKVGNKPYTFRYYKHITELISLLENLVKYRMVEYEEPED